MARGELILYIDGASQGNPGPAGAGIVLLKKTEKGIKKILEDSMPLGRCTNNTAEYQALIFGLSKASELKAKRIKILSDSQLLVRQIKREYRIRNPSIFQLYNKVKSALTDFSHWEIQHIPREKNKEADRLASFAILQNQELAIEKNKALPSEQTKLPLDNNLEKK